MSDALLVALYLIPGFCFIKSWIFTRYRLTRSTDQFLIYETATYSLVLFFASHALLTILGNDVYKIWESLAITNAAKFSSTIQPTAFSVYTALNLIVSFIIVGIVRLLTQILARAGVDPRVSAADDLERLLRTCIRHDLDACITLKSGKVYIGRVLTSLNTPESARETITIVPILSGYRNDQHELLFTTDYSGIQGGEEDVVSEKEQESSSRPDPQPAEAFLVVIPTSEIATYQTFSLETYERFQKQALSKR